MRASCHTCVVSNTLATLVQEEYVVYKLDRKGFADPTAKRMEDTCNHETTVASRAGCTDEASKELVQIQNVSSIRVSCWVGEDIPLPWKTMSPAVGRSLDIEARG